jgi:hypothetical protein
MENKAGITVNGTNYYATWSGPQNKQKATFHPALIPVLPSLANCNYDAATTTMNCASLDQPGTNIVFPNCTSTGAGALTYTCDVTTKISSFQQTSLDSLAQAPPVVTPTSNDNWIWFVIILLIVIILIAAVAAKQNR